MTKFSLESEQALLGILLFDPDAFESLEAGLAPQHFYEQLHGRMFKIIVARAGKGEATDPVIMHDLLKDDKAYFELGAIKYLADIVDRAPPSSILNDYAAVILSSWQVRELDDVWQAVLPIEDPTEKMDMFKQHVERIESYTRTDDGGVSEAEVAGVYIDKLSQQVKDGKGMGLLTGLECMDTRLGGLKPGDLIILAGRPSMGKSSSARNVLSGAAKLNPEHDFYYYSLEMTADDLVARALSSAAYYGGKKIPYNLGNRPTEGFVRDMAMYRQDLCPNLYYLDEGEWGIESLSRSIKKKARQAKAKGRKLGAIVVDYLQIMAMSKAESVNLSIGIITRGLKLLAKKLGVTIILLSQVSRKVEERENKRPQAADLKESGKIEDDADVIIFPFRKYHYLKMSPPKKDAERLDWEDECERSKNLIEFIFDKVRRGDRGSDNLFAAMPYDLIANSDPLSPSAFI